MTFFRIFTQLIFLNDLQEYYSGTSFILQLRNFDFFILRTRTSCTGNFLLTEVSELVVGKIGRILDG